jgi:amidase
VAGWGRTGHGGEAFDYHVQRFFAFAQPDTSFDRMGELVEYEQRRMAVREAWDRYFRELDAFLCPVNFTVAFPHDPNPFEERVLLTPDGARRYDGQRLWISHASLPGVPGSATHPTRVADRETSCGSAKPFARSASTTRPTA